MNSEVLELPLTTSITNKDLKIFKDTPMQVSDWPSHTQRIERCVRMITEFADHVYSHETREGYIIAQAVNRQLMKRNNNKKYMMVLATFK